MSQFEVVGQLVELRAAMPEVRCPSEESLNLDASDAGVRVATAAGSCRLSPLGRRDPELVLCSAYTATARRR